MRISSAYCSMAHVALAGTAAALSGCQNVGSEYSSIREALLTSVSMAREAPPAEAIVLEPASLDPAATDAPPVRRRPEWAPSRALSPHKGGAFLDRTQAEGVSCLLPSTPTYHCFTGAFEAVVAGDPAKIGAHPPQPIPKRGPSTFLYQDRIHGVAFYGHEDEGAPVPLVGDRVFSPALERYLNELLHRLLRQAPIAPPEMKAFLIRSTWYGATATPDGDIFVSLGALNAVQTEDQLAALLAHQAAHLLLSHFDRVAFINTARRRVEAVSNAALRVAPGGLEAPSNAEAELMAAIAVEAEKSIELASFDSSWEGRVEDEADFLAVDLLVRAGYAPSAVLDRLALSAEAARERASREVRPRVADERLVEAPGEQNSKIAEVIGVLDALSDAATPELGELFRRPRLIQEARFADLDHYMRRQHDAALSRVGAMGGLEKAKSAASFDRLYLDYQQVEAASNLLRQRRAGAAAEILEATLRGPIGGDPYPQALRARTLAALGDWAGALDSFNALPAGALMSPDGYILKARLETKLGSPRAALLTTQHAGDRYGPSPFLALQIAALAAVNDVQSAEFVASQCEDVAAASIREACKSSKGLDLGVENARSIDAKDSPPPASAHGWVLGDVVETGARKFRSLF
ncbi:MAG: M48 family metalloprotease [Rhodobacteraceae bacterium]|nr:M48 family metalloprotease [Paracoccaceae bacterium]